MVIRASRSPTLNTVLDLAATGSDGDVVTLVTDALRLRLTTPRDSASHLSGGTDIPGAGC